MSNAETNILLPTAGIDFFLRDHATMEAARALVDDWRFSRVTVSVEEGDVETAIQSYQSTKSPALVIIETETTDESFSARLEALSAHCAEGTHAIVIGPVNDVNLYRQLTAMGVRDYLVRPVATQALSEVIAGTLIEQLGASGSRLIAMVGAKGGVGVSALLQALAWGLSDKLAQKTFVLDAAGGWSSLGVGMGFEPLGTLNEAMRAATNRDHDTLKRMVFHPSDRLSVLASGAESLLDTNLHAQQYEELIDMLLISNPLVMVDLSSAVPALKRIVINRAHEIILVAQPTLTSLRAARTLMQEIKSLHGGQVEKIDLLINMQGMAPGKEVPKADIAAALGVTPALILPYDAKLFLGMESDGRKITDEKNGLSFVESLMPLAQKVMSGKGQADPSKSGGDQAGVIGGLLGRLKK